MVRTSRHPEPKGYSMPAAAASARSSPRLSLTPTVMRTVTVGTRGPNPRTVTVPAGIDPGWAYPPGRSRIDGIAPPGIEAPRTTAEYVLEGRRLRDEITAAVDRRPGDAGFRRAVLGELRRRLKAERGAGAVQARVGAAERSKQDVAAAKLVKDGAAEFPRSWIRAANRVRVSVRHLPPGASSVFGDYVRKQPRAWNLAVLGRADYLVPEGRAAIRTIASPSTALHEYVHHLQDTVPGLDRAFVALHRRRTTAPDGTRDPIRPLRGYGREGREDRYVDAYFGTEYRPPTPGGWPDGPGEVITRTFQVLFHSISPWGRLVDMETLLNDDPELLDFALGLLFRFDPE